jgi:hypothetical protein
MAAAVMAVFEIAQPSPQMKTDAYTECRGAGRIGDNARPVDQSGQASGASAPNGAGYGAPPMKPDRDSAPQGG